MKQGTLHREWSLWNQLVLSQDSTTAVHNSLQQPPSPVSDIAVTAEVSKEYNEKHVQSAIPVYSAYNKKDNIAKEHQRWFPKMLMFGKVLTSLLIAYTAVNFISGSSFFTSLFINFSDSCSNQSAFSLANVQDYHPVSFVDGYYAVEGSEVHEVIDFPLFPYADVSAPAYSALLLNHTFASSWNRPAAVTYYPPPSNITYNRIILTLDTTVDGVQYDRLAHIYLNDNEIWRSSTIEPAGRLSHSFTQKDVTMYSTLFSEEGSLLVQLDNLVTKRLTGEFHVEINALYFNDLEDDEFIEFDNEDNEFLTLKNPFGRNLSTHPSFIPLTPNKIADNIPPIVYYPDAKLSNIRLPIINYNTTKLLLLVSTSGNAAEEFWYSNLVDEYKDHFLSHEHHFDGHGSCRVINIYVNGIRIHSTNPKPYVFTGGVSPTLWNPIVSTGSFDLLPYHIDLTPILPLLWEEPSSTLAIEISNCIDDDEKSVIKSGIGSNWITSASLAVWENEDIDDSFGSYEILDNTTAIKAFAFAPPFSGMLTQIIKADYKNSLQTNITYTFKDGTQLSSLKNYESSANQTSMIFISKFGDAQSCLTVIKSNSTKSNVDLLTLEPIDSFSMLSNNTLKSKLAFLEPEVADDITFNVNISVEFDTGAYAEMSPLAEIKSKENGTAVFTLSPSGNHGTGSVLHNYTLSTVDGLLYNREALTNNSVILYDNITITEPTTELTVLESDFIPATSPLSKLDKLSFLTLEERKELELMLDEQEVADLISALTMKDKKEHCH